MIGLTKLSSPFLGFHTIGTKSMANAQTEHSKNLRRKAASKRKTENLKTGVKKKWEMIGDPSVVDEVKERLQSIPRDTTQKGQDINILTL